MVNAMKKLLQADLGIPKEKIKIEEFTGKNPRYHSRISFF
jgi:hypothetical protein